MDIRCGSCSKLFRVADEKIAGKGIRFKCSKCAEIITITKDDFEMDLLAREGEAAEQTPEPATRTSPPTSPEPAIKPVSPQPVPTPEPEAREYKPPQEHDIPPAALSDFDFSEPHAAATAAAHPEEGFGGQDFSFNVEPEQESAPEVEITPEAAAEAEAALQFPADLISEPKRKPVFGAPAAGEEMAHEESKQESDQNPITTPMFAQSSSQQVQDMGAEEEIDLGAALAMPKDPIPEPEPAAAIQRSDPGADQVLPKGPVITPELMAQMMKRSTTSGKSAAPAKATPSVDEDIDLGAALAMPKSSKTAAKVESETAYPGTATAEASRRGETALLGKSVLVIGVIMLALVIVLAALYYLGFLGGKDYQDVQQKPQQKSEPKTPPARQEIGPEGLSIVDPAAFVDPERGDLVITGKILNTTDKPKPGWYLVTEVRDAKESILATAHMVNGIQIFSKTEQETLVKRGVKLDELQKKIASLGEGTILPKGSVPFEVRVMNPPAGSARFLPVLRALNPAALDALKREGSGTK